MFNLHIFHSDNFLSHTKHQFDSVGAKNHKYVVLDPEFKGVENTFGISANEAIEFIKKNNPDSIILHYLGGLKAKVLVESGYSGKVHWSSWGADVYNTIFGVSLTDLLEPETYDFAVVNGNFEKPNRVFSTSNKLVRDTLLRAYPILKGEAHAYQYIQQALDLISSCSTVMPYEFELIKKRYPTIEYYPFSYVNLDNIIPRQLKNFNPQNLRPNVLVGNSSSPTMNHIEALDKLENLNSKVPLSYGSKLYKKGLINRYKNRENVELITDYLPYNDYLKFLTSCNTMVMNCKRQQAVANIVLGLYLGMRLYLHASNPMLHFLKSMGAVVFDFQKEFEKFRGSVLSIEEVEANRKVIEKYWGGIANKERMVDFMTYYSSASSERRT